MQITDTQKHKLNKDKNLCMFVGISQVTLIKYRDSKNYINRYRAYKEYFDNFLNSLTSEQADLLLAAPLKFKELKENYNTLNNLSAD